MDEVTVPSDIARDIAKFIRNSHDSSMDHLADILDPINLNDRLFKVINFYIKSDGDPSSATREVMTEILRTIDSVRVIEESFIIKNDLISLFNV
jgi:hypothetical protein